MPKENAIKQLERDGQLGQAEEARAVNNQAGQADQAAQSEQEVETENVNDRISPAIELIRQYLERAKAIQESREELENQQKELEEERINAEVVEDQNELLYVTLDGDNIGNVVFQAEQSDDEQMLKEVDQRISSGQVVMKMWAEENNGVVVQSGGDEGLLKVPRKAMERLEELRQRYYDSVKATVTVGVGRKISEAMAARQLGKLQGKDRTVEFSETTQQELENRIEQDDSDCAERLKTCIQSGGKAQTSEKKSHPEAPIEEPEKELGDEPTELTGATSTEELKGEKTPSEQALEAGVPDLEEPVIGDFTPDPYTQGPEPFVADEPPQPAAPEHPKPEKVAEIAPRRS
jgi:hypothetical protein